MRCPHCHKEAELKVLEKQAQVQAKSNLLADKQLQLYARQQADQRMHAGTRCPDGDCRAADEILVQLPPRPVVAGMLAHANLASV